MAINTDGCERPSTKGEAILELLTQKVRVVTELQAANTYFAGNARPNKAARETLRALEQKGLVVLSRSLLHPVLSLEAPLFVWKPGDTAPDTYELAWQIQKRWKATPTQTLMARATDRARTITGGTIGGRPQRRTEMLHDIHVTELYLTLCHTQPEVAQSWTHEDTLHEAGRFKTGDKIPDAVTLRDGLEVALDFGGRYKAEKLELIHTAMVKESMAYEIW